MKAASKRYFGIVALIWVGYFILFSLAYVVVLLPQKKSKSQVEKKFIEAKQEHDHSVQAAKDEAQAQLSKETECLRDRLQQFVIDPEDSANLTFDISQIADENGLASFSIRSKDDREGPMALNCDHIRERQIHVGFNAEFNQFASFLNTLERNRPVLFVDRFLITRSDQDDSGHQVSMDLAVFVTKQQGS